MSGAVPPPAVRPLERAARVPRPVCPGCGRCGRVDPAPAPQRAPLWAGVARCGGGGRASTGGVPSGVVRGAWCQALSLPRPPVLWSGQPGFRDPCVPGAVDACVWTQHRPPSVRPCGPALLAVGVAEGRPPGGAFHRCEGRLVSGAVPPPAARPLERAARVPRPVCPGCGRCGRVDPAPAPQRAPLRAGVARCGGGGRASPGGGAFHRCEGRLVSGAVPPPAARPLERAARVPRPACPGHGRCGRGDAAPAPQRAPLRAGVARCGGGGRASPGGVPSTIVRGAWGQAGCRVSLGVCGVCGVCAVRVVVRGAGLPLVLRCSPLRCLGAVLCSPCARRVPSPVRAPCSSAGHPWPPAQQRAPLRAGVARCGGGGRASPGGVLSTIVRGVWGQAPSLPRLPAQWAGCWGPPPTCCERGCVGVGVQHCHLACMPCGGCMPRGWWGAVPGGGGLPPL